MGEKFFTVSFDDGTEQDVRLIELMEAYGIKGTFNLSSGIFGRKTYIRYDGSSGKTAAAIDPLHPELYVNHFILDKETALRVYSKPNVEVASHGTHHLVQTELTAQQAEEEITRDFTELSKLFGYKIVGHAFPKGTYNSNVIEALRKNGAYYVRKVSRGKPKDFSFDRSSLLLTPTCRHTDEFSDELLRDFIETPAGSDDMVFVLWGHSYELDYGTRLGCFEHLEGLFKAVSRANGIRFVTNRGLFER